MDRQFTQIKMDILAKSATVSHRILAELQDKLLRGGIPSVKSLDCTKLDERRPGAGSLKALLVGTEEEVRQQKVKTRVAMKDLARLLRKS